MSDHDYKIHEHVNIEKVITPTTDDKLTDDARVLLAFIRDNPGSARYEIVEQLEMDSSRLRHALWPLFGHRLIVSHMRPTKHFAEQKSHVLASTYYAV